MAGTFFGLNNQHELFVRGVLRINKSFFEHRILFLKQSYLALMS